MSFNRKYTTKIASYYNKLRAKTYNQNNKAKTHLSICTRLSVLFQLIPSKRKVMRGKNLKKQISNRIFGHTLDKRTVILMCLQF